MQSPSPSTTPLKEAAGFPWPAQELPLEGAVMRYVDEGRGQPILMLHGNPTWSFYYRRLIEVFQLEYRVIAPDHVGCGRSDKPQHYSYTLRQHIDNVERLIDCLALDRVTLIVHDWGGAIGFGAAVRRPERFRRLVVLNTSAFFGPIPWRIGVCRLPGFGEVAVRMLNGFARGAIVMACKHRERMTPDVRAGYLAPYDSYAHRVAVLRFIRDIPLRRSQDSHAVLTDIESRLGVLRDHPMLICWGGRDFCFNDVFLNGWRTRFPGAEVHRFPDAGHYVLEDAHERIIPLLISFMS